MLITFKKCIFPKTAILVFSSFKQTLLRFLAHYQSKPGRGNNVTSFSPNYLCFSEFLLFMLSYKNVNLSFFTIFKMMHNMNLAQCLLSEYAALQVKN